MLYPKRYNKNLIEDIFLCAIINKKYNIERKFKKCKGYNTKDYIIALLLVSIGFYRKNQAALIILLERLYLPHDLNFL